MYVNSLQPSFDVNKALSINKHYYCCYCCCYFKVLLTRVWWEWRRRRRCWWWWWGWWIFPTLASTDVSVQECTPRCVARYTLNYKHPSTVVDLSYLPWQSGCVPELLCSRDSRWRHFFRLFQVGRLGTEEGLCNQLQDGRRCDCCRWLCLWSMPRELQ